MANSSSSFNRAQGDYVKDFKAIEEMFSLQGNEDPHPNIIQGNMFEELAQECEADLKITCLLSSLECYSRSSSDSSMYLAQPLFDLAEVLGSLRFYKKSLGKAEEGSRLITGSSVLIEFKEKLDSVIQQARSRIDEFDEKNRVAYVPKIPKEVVYEENEAMEKLIRDMRVYWNNLDLDVKRKFLRVHTQELMFYIKNLFTEKHQDALNRAITYAKKNETWILWLCRACTENFFSAEGCKSHFEIEHAARSSRHDLPWTVSAPRAREISVGEWKPVDVVAAVTMIKQRLADVKAFAYQDGWCKDWPLAEHAERSKSLQQIRSLLVSFTERKVLTVSILDCLMDYVVQKLEKFDVSKQMLTDCRLLDTPQSICFLECAELKQVLDFLGHIKCERDDGTDRVCAAVDSLCDETRFKEKMDFDSQFSVLLVDKKLLHSKLDRFDDEGKISVLNPDLHYASARVQGDEIVSWLIDGSLPDDKSLKPIPIKEDNLVLWMAVLRVVQFMCRNLETKRAKKQSLEYQVHDFEVKMKMARLDVKIVLIEQRRKTLLDSLTRISAFDHRCYVRGYIRSFLFASLSRDCVLNL